MDISFKDLIDPSALINALGLIGVITVVFVESGLFFGFFLPGDSLLFTAGFLASQGYIPIVPLVIGTFIAAVAGDSVGYFFGKKVGPAIFVKDNSMFFNKKHVARAQHFYETHGKKTIILARFIPIVRTFAPIVAGVGNMNYKDFISYNVIGGLLWAVGMSLLGYFFGNIIPNAKDYMHVIIAVIILTSFIPPIIHIFRRKKGSDTGTNM
jgi:membrane-associated protein